MKNKKKIIYTREEFAKRKEKETAPEYLKGINLEIYKEYTYELLENSLKIIKELEKKGVKNAIFLVLTMLSYAICNISFGGIKNIEEKKKAKEEILNLINNTMNYFLKER